MGDKIIQLDQVVYQYPDAQTRAVNDVTLDVEKGEFLAILGRNGSGKSTLAKLMNALLTPTGGTVTVGGLRATDENPYDVRALCGMVFQNPDNQIVATVVEEDCAFGLENMGVPSDEIRARVDEALREVGMADRAASSPSRLSGGQKQRVAIAGVLAMRPRIIVFDESTAMLDPVGRKEIFAIAKRLNREEGITIVWITHFMEEAVQADRVVVMDAGSIVLQGAPRDVFSNVDQVLALGLDVPEMARLAALLRAGGMPIRNGIMRIDEMAVELCRLLK
ncbi:MAG: energy-coupling factor transporter ATPase [Clostridia bacterium]|nr:energy-coupling factor transporter ATPase [Clostridia bacterium]